jgi:ParB-like chromosome segregation protein Spo0J
MTKNIQLPLLTDPIGELIMLKLYDITPVEDLDCQEPDPELIAMVAQSWVPPIIVCPDNRFVNENNHNLYYPIDGKRRIKAVAYLDGLGYEFQGIPVSNMPIQAILRKDLHPQDENAYRLAFQVNNLRSPNVSTDVNAIRSTAQSLGVDVFTKEGRSAIAKVLRSNPATIARLAKGIMVDQVVVDAYQRSEISRETFTAIAEMTDIQAKNEVARRLTDGEKLTKGDIVAYKKEAKQIELVQSVASRPANVQASEGNPLTEAIEWLEVGLETINEPEAIPIRKAYDLLKTLL